MPCAPAIRMRYTALRIGGNTAAYHIGRPTAAMANTLVIKQLVIDSLLNCQMSVVDVKLNVTDQSKSTVYGRYNKGSTFMPQERKYILEIDSSSVYLR